MTLYAHVPTDKPEACERQADIAELESRYKFKLSQHRHNQVFIRRRSGSGDVHRKIGK